MEIYINADKSPAAVQLKPTSQPISALRIKRGAIVPLDVTVLGSTTASNLRFGLKSRNAYGSDLLLLAGADSGTPAEDGMHFALSLDVSSAPLHDALGIGSGEPLAALAAMAEFEWVEGSAVRLSDTIQTTVLNDIIASSTDVPAAVIAEYPAADRVATKDWVNALAATASTQGLVKLGTGDVVPASEAVAVGVGADGGLAVSSVTLSAYAAACRHGFTGTEEEWLASLKGERGDKGDTGETGSFSDTALEEILHQDVEQSVAVTGTDNANTYGFALVTKRAGRVKSLTVTTRLSASPFVNGTPLYCKLWVVVDGDTAHPQFIALSDNAEIQVIGEENTWLFPTDHEPELPVGSQLRFTFHTEANSVNTTYGSGLSQIGVRCAANTDPDIGCLGAGAGINTTAVVPVHTLTLRSDNFAPAQHVDDTSAHVSESDRTTWDAAAAQLNAAPVFNSYPLTDATPPDASLFVQESVLEVEINYLDDVVDAIGSLSMHSLCRNMPDNTSLTLILRLGDSMASLDGITLEPYMGECFVPPAPASPVTAWGGKLTKVDGTLYYPAVPLIGY